MADQPDSITAPEIHELTGSSPPGGQAPAFKPIATPRPRPRPRLHRHPLGLRDVSDEAEVVDLAKRLVRLLKRAPIMVQRLGVLKLQPSSLDKQEQLEKLIDRTRRRINRLTHQLATTKAPTARASAMKGDALVEIAILEGRRSDPFDALALSVAHDRVHLGIEETCLPNTDSEFGKYHEEILRLHAEMNNGDLTEDEANARMDRWGAIDRLALSTRATTISDAAGCLAYARREFVQFEMNDGEGDDNPSHRLVLHLLDGAIAALGRVEPALGTTPAELVSCGSDERATVSQMADIEFEPWDEDGSTLPPNAKWSDLVHPYLVTSRLAQRIVAKTKPQLIDVVRNMEDGNGEDILPKLVDDLIAAGEFFENFGKMVGAAEIRLMCAVAALSREQGDPEAQPGYREAKGEPEATARVA